MMTAWRLQRACNMNPETRAQLRVQRPARSGAHFVTAPLLRCAGCDAQGRAPTIVDKTVQDPRPVLRPTFDWHADGRAALLCDNCRKCLERRKRRRRARAP
jgi:hypothetical protein